MAVRILGEPWDNITGCTKISQGCKHCYAERFTKWLKNKGTEKYQAGFHHVICHPYVLDLVKVNGQPRTYFVNSMADTFHDDVPDAFILDIFERMNKCKQHTFQILTKRTKRLLDLSACLNYTDNIWQGVSVESGDYLHRIDDLRQVDAKTKFIMFEPLIGPVGELNLSGIDWAIVGGESGEGFRPMKSSWAREIRDQCVDANVKFVFKQFAGYNPESMGRLLDGRLWDERPLYECEKIKTVDSVRKDLDKFLEW